MTAVANAVSDLSDAAKGIEDALSVSRRPASLS